MKPSALFLLLTLTLVMLPQTTQAQQMVGSDSAHGAPRVIHW